MSAIGPGYPRPRRANAHANHPRTTAATGSFIALCGSQRQRRRDASEHGRWCTAPDLLECGLLVDDSRVSPTARRRHIGRGGGAGGDDNLRERFRNTIFARAGGDLPRTMTPNEGLGDEPAGSRGGLELIGLCRHGIGPSFPSRRLRARPNVLAGAQQSVPSRNRYTMTMVPAYEDNGNGVFAQITVELHDFGSCLLNNAAQICGELFARIDAVSLRLAV